MIGCVATTTNKTHFDGPFLKNWGLTVKKVTQKLDPFPCFFPQIFPLSTPLHCRKGPLLVLICFVISVILIVFIHLLSYSVMWSSSFCGYLVPYPVIILLSWHQSAVCQVLSPVSSMIYHSRFNQHLDLITHSQLQQGREST